MPEEGINGKSEEPIRRALKKLPQVKAAPDFEARLQRRLNEPERHEGGRTRFGFISFRVPALGYSLVALVLVGVVNHFMFWRTGVVPVSTQEMVAPPPAASSEGKTESAPHPFWIHSLQSPCSRLFARGPCSCGSGFLLHVLADGCRSGIDAGNGC